MLKESFAELWKYNPEARGLTRSSITGIRLVLATS
jgi:hypothetical protein